MANRTSMKESLKLNRTILMLDRRETWPNAYRMWTAYPKLMTSAQVDRLTRQLYAAAKKGERKIVVVNGLSYCLWYVEGAEEWVF